MIQHSKIIATLLITVLTGAAARSLMAQSGAGKLGWETLLQEPLPADSVPQVSVFSLPVGPAPVGVPPPGRGHTHAGPVFAYLVQGEIENQVEPDPPQIYQPGGFFYEAPMHVHRFLRNRSATEPAKLIVFQAGDTGQAAPVIKLLLRAPLRTTIDQELSLFRLTLPVGAHADARAHSGPGIVYVLEGKIELSGTADQPDIHNAGDVFLEPATQRTLAFKNASDSGPAILLLYQVNQKDAKGSAR